MQDVIQREISKERLCFLNQINKENIEERKTLRNQILSFVLDLLPTKHIKAQDIHLEVDELIELKKKIAEMKEAFEENKKFFKTQIRDQQKLYDDLVIKQKADIEHFQRIIDEQNEDAKKMSQQSEAQMQQMHEGFKKMQMEYQQTSQEIAKQIHDEREEFRKALEQWSQSQALRTDKTKTREDGPSQPGSTDKSVCLSS